jgi:hypothetical protein
VSWLEPYPADAEFPFSLRRERPDLENPFQRSRTADPQIAQAGPATDEPTGAVQLASLTGTWVDPPMEDVSTGVADVLVTGETCYGQPLLFESCESPWFWQVLPDGLIYRSYMAGPREPRLSLTTFHEKGSEDWLWDGTLGGRAALLRYGNGNLLKPEGYEIQIEAATLIRLNLEQNRDVDSADYRVGVPLVYGTEIWQFKTGYYHLSSHLGDEFIDRVPNAERINYVRDAIMLGVSFYPVPALRLYAEVDYAFYMDGGAEPWEFLIGFEFAEPGPTGFAGTPFVAANGHLREEINYGGDFCFQAGWLWRGNSGSMLRTGFHFLTGKSPQYQFYNTSEEQVGFGVWYDF